MSAAMTALIGEPARRPPTYPAIIGPAGWIHQRRKERIRITRDDDQNENGGPTSCNRIASVSTSVRLTPGWPVRPPGLAAGPRRRAVSSLSFPPLRPRIHQ